MAQIAVHCVSWQYFTPRTWTAEVWVLELCMLAPCVQIQCIAPLRMAGLPLLTG